jgi:hypothetical protein
MKSNNESGVMVDQIVTEYSSMLGQPLVTCLEKAQAPKNILYEVDCLLDCEDCIMAMSVYTLNSNLPRTLNEEMTGLFNRLLYSSYNSRNAMWITHLMKLINENCRVPHLNINMFQ